MKLNLSVGDHFLFISFADHKVNFDIKQEARMFGDVLQEDFVDSYLNLVLKSLFSLR